MISLYWDEIQKHPTNEKLYLEFLQFTESHNLYNEELKIYQKAIQHFNDKNWYHKIARWYIRYKGDAEFRNFTEQTKDIFGDSELSQYFQNFVHYRYPISTPESEAYHRLYLYAHNKFPKNLNFVKGLLQFYNSFGLGDDFCTLSEEYYLYDEGIRINYIAYLSRKNLLRERLSNIKDKEGLSYLRLRADANSWLSFHPEALGEYQQLSEYYPGEVELNSKLAELYRSLDFCFEYAKIDFTYKSAEIYLRLSKIYPHQLEFYEKAGEVYAEVGRFNKASEIWDKMVCVQRGDENIYLNVATLYWDYYQFQRAVDLFKQIRKIKGNPRLYSSQLAAVYECLKDYPSAIDEYITNIVSDRWGSYNQKQRLRFLAKNKNLAETIKKRFERAIKQRPKEHEVIFAYADFLNNIDRPDEVKRLYRRTYNKYKDIDFLNELYNYFTEIKDEGYQEKILKQEIQISNQDPYYFRKLANFYEANKKHAKAKDVYLGLLTSIKDNEEERSLYIELLLEVSNYLDRIQDFDGSLRLLEEASQLTKGQQREGLLGQLAQKLIAQNQFKKAGEILHTLIKASPTNTYYFNTLSQVYTKSGDLEGLANLYKEAIETIKKAKLNEEDTTTKIIELRFGLIDAYIKLSKFVSAQDQYIEILNRKPLNEGYVVSAYQFSKEHKLRDRILKFYQKTSEQAFKDYRWNVLLATFYLDDKGYDTAIKELEKALVNEPQRLELYHKLVDLYLKLEIYDKAVVTYKQIYTLDDYNSIWLIKIGELYNRIGKRQKAIEAVNKLTEGNPPEFGKYFKLASLYEGWGMLNEAVVTLESGLKKLVLLQKV